jgi:transposase-like protein
MNSAQQRAALILQVRSGQLTATEAARQWGVSRQQYYQWERRALQALLRALSPQPKGRPRKRASDPDRQALLSQIRQLEQRVQRYEQKEKLRALVNELEESRTSRGSATKKNNK